MGKNRSASMFNESRLREERRESSMKSLAMKDLPVEMLKKIMKPDYAPAWYTKELQKAGIASERIVDILPVSALDNPRTQEHEDATEELMKLLGVREGISLLDRIEEVLR